MYFSVSFIAALLIPVAVKSGAVLSVFLASLIVGSVHGINIWQTCMLPRSIGNTEQLGFISGIFNGCVYIGSALSTYGFARISEIFGWNGTIISWVIIALLGTVTIGVCKIIDKEPQK